MREPRAFAELETKIGQEEKPVQKPVKKEPVSAGKKPDPRKSWELWDKNLSLLNGDDIEASNKAAEEFGAEFSKHLNPKQLDEFDTLIGTYKSPDEVESYMTKVIGKRPAKKTEAPKQEELFKEFEEEFDDWGSYIYEGLTPEQQAKTLAERKKVPYETAKAYIDTMAKDRENAYKGALAQFPKIEEAIVKAYPKGSDDYKTFDSQFLTGILSDYLPMPLGSDQREQVEKEFAKYLKSKGYTDVSANPLDLGKPEYYIDKYGKKVRILGYTDSGKRIIPYKDWERHVGKKGVQDRVQKWIDSKIGKGNK